MSDLGGEHHRDRAGVGRTIAARRPMAGTADRAAAAWGGPCAGDPTRWDLDVGTLTQWLAAMRECVNCPVLEECVALRDEFFPGVATTHRATGNPSGVIWAGVAYSETGVPLDGRGLRLYAARRRSGSERSSHTREPRTVPASQAV